MKAIIKQGKKLLFLSGASGKAFENIKDELIVNFNHKWTLNNTKFLKKTNTLEIRTHVGTVLITFSAPVENIEMRSYEKDQIVFLINKVT